jgi:hypothetical protein
VPPIQQDCGKEYVEHEDTYVYGDIAFGGIENDFHCGGDCTILLAAFNFFRGAIE